jgi:hypothetical protein
VKQVAGFISEGIYTITRVFKDNSAFMEAIYSESSKQIVEEYNGVDGDNNPFNFTDDMFEVGQRVITHNGTSCIVMPNTQTVWYPDYKIGFAHSNGWVEGSLKHSSASSDEYDVVEIYKQPEYMIDALKTTCKGALIWRRDDKVIERLRIKEEIAKLEEELASL